MKDKLKKVNKGTTQAEYALMAGVVTLSIIGSLTVFSDEIESAVCDISNAVSGGSVFDCSQDNSDTANDQDIVTGPPASNDLVEEPDEPADVTRYNSAGSTSGTNISWLGLPVQNPRGQSEFPDDKNMDETRYLKYIPDERINCNVTTCGTNIFDIPSSETPLAFFLNAGGTKQIYSLYLDGNHNLDIDFVANENKSANLIPYVSSPQPLKLRVDANQSDINYFSIGATDANFFDGDFIVNNQGISLNPELSDISSGTIVNVVRRNREVGNFIEQQTIDNPGNLTYLCRYVGNTDDLRSHAYYSSGYDSFIGFDEVEVVNPNGPNTKYRFYVGSLFDSEYVGYDGICDINSPKHHYTKYMKNFPDDPGVTRAYSSFNIQYSVDYTGVNQSDIVEGDQPLVETGYLKYIFSNSVTRNNRNQVNYTCFEDAPCTVSILNIPANDPEGEPLSLIYDSNQASLDYRGLPVGNIGLEIRNSGKKTRVESLRSGTPSEVRSSLSVNANNGSVEFHQEAGFNYQTFDLKNGIFVTPRNTFRQIRLIPGAIESDTLVHIPNNTSIFSELQFANYEDRFIDRQAPNAVNYQYSCRSGIGGTDIVPGFIDVPYDEVEGIDESGRKLTYRFYIRAGEDPDQREFIGYDGPCSPEQLENSRYFTSNNT